MTNKEALQAVLLGIVVEDNSLLKTLTDHAVTFNEEYTKDKRSIINVCALDILNTLLSAADFSEGDMSVKYDKSAIEMRIGRLTGAMDEAAGISLEPKIRSPKVW